MTSTSLADRLRAFVREATTDDGSGRRLALLVTPPASSASLPMNVLPNDLQLLTISPGDHVTEVSLLRDILRALGLQPTGRSGVSLRQEIRAALEARPVGATGIAILHDDLRGSQLELIHALLQDNADARLWIILVGSADLRDRVRRRQSLLGHIGLEAMLTADDVAHVPSVRAIPRDGAESSRTMPSAPSMMSRTTASSAPDEVVE